MVNVLFVMPSMFEAVYAHIVRFLREQGCCVEILVISSETELESHPDCPTESIFANRAFVRHCRKRYDVIIFCTHCHNHSRMRRFQKRVSPRLGYIFLEHDFLTPVQHTERGITTQSTLGIVCFQTKHYRFLTQAGYCTVMARWNKLDADYPAYEMEGASPWEDAVLIGSFNPDMVWRLAKDAEFEYPGIFRTIWYKPWNMSDRFVKNGTVRLTQFFESPQGGKYCADIAKFHLTCGSSSYLDALLFGCMPILYFPRGGPMSDGRGNTIEFQETPVDGIVSSVSFEAFDPGLAVTAADLPRKVEALRSDQTLFERVRSRLMAEWFPEGYALLPKAEEAVWNLIRRRL